jgi:tetratricopeptide (TPR) repeat protein
MKICPFMSHMLGSEGTGVLEIGAQTQSGTNHDVVVLGYDGGSSVGVKTERKASRTASRDAQPQSSHLYCLRETCRFYRAKDGECTFDAIFSSVEQQAQQAKQAQKEARSSGKDQSAAAVARELDKFWKFQTKSVEELISSFGDVEKRQEEMLTRLKTDVRESISAIAPKGEDEDTMNTIRDGVAEIKDTIDARNDGFDSLTMTVSDLVVSFEDGLKMLKGQWEQLSSRIAALEAMAPRVERMETGVSRSNENIDRLENNWAELMDLVRHERKKNAEDPAAAQAKRREAMKFNNLGVTSFHNGDLMLARDQFMEAVRRDDSFAECYNNLGLVCTELGEEESAATAFEKAIKLNPDLHAAYNNLGYVFYKQGSYDRAVEMYNEALGRSSNNSSAYTNLGNAYFKLGKRDEARHSWQKALELDPANEKAQRSLKSLDES